MSAAKAADATMPACAAPTTTCEGGGFCSVTAGIVTLVALLAWMGLSRASFLEPAEAWQDTMGAAFVTANLLAIGIKPWLYVVFGFQVLAAGTRMISDWVCARNCTERAEVYRWMAGLATIIFVLMTMNKVTWIRVSAAANHSLQAMPGPDILAALALGSMAAAGLLFLLQKFGPGFGFTMVAIFAIASKIAPRLAPYGTWFREHWFVGGLQALLMVFTGWALVWLVGMTYEAPADLTPAGRDAPPIQVPVLVVGILPLVLSDFGMRVLRGALRGTAAEFHLFGPVAGFTESLLAPGSWLAPFVQLALVWLLTGVVFSLLYPSHRLEQIFGLSRERIDESLESFLDGLMIQNALILCALFAVSRVCAGTFGQLGISAASFLVLVAGIAAVRRNLLYRRALTEQAGGLVNAKTVLGMLEAEVARARLAAAGIPAYLDAWTIQELHPATITGMGEINVMVPHRVADEAKKLLA